MPKLRIRILAAVAPLLFLQDGTVFEVAAPPVFSNPAPVTIRGYTGDAMEPFITRDGRFLLFNNLNDPSVNTNLHYAARVDDRMFQYRGELRGVNTPALEGTPTLDRNNVLYFVSPRNYGETFSTIYRSRFRNGTVSEVELVPGISRQQPGIVNFDVDISPNGKGLYFVDSQFTSNGLPETADLVIAERLGPAFRRVQNSGRILRNVNSAALEYAPCISADGLTLFFTRTPKAGIPAIFRSTRAAITKPFSRPTRLAALEGFVEGPALSPDEHSLYYHKRVGDRFVIYRAVATPPVPTVSP